MMGKQRYFDLINDDTNNKTKEPEASVEPVVPQSSPNKIVTIVAKTNKKRKWVVRKQKNGPNKKGKTELPLIPREKHLQYSRGAGFSSKSKSNESIRTNVKRAKILKQDEKFKSGIELATRSEVLLTDFNSGIEVEEGECSLTLNQCDIVKQVDFASATKSFHLNLDEFAPYKIDYTLNGRYLALGGRKGHIAAFDWVTKRLLTEFNVMESVHDIKWLHNETLFAVAQKQWTYVYDNQGIEIHCLKSMDKIQKLDFLPYHFLLVGGHESGFLSWVDVSIGKIVSQFRSGHGSVDVMTTNPSNAIVHCGHSNGTVSLWSPNIKTSLASILTHGAPLTSIAIDITGRLMATGAVDGKLRIWDLRNSFTPLTSVTYGTPTALSFSQKGLLALSSHSQTRIYSEIGRSKKPFLKHVSHGSVTSSQFCPFEDVLGLGTSRGFDSCLVPGAGEANFDALERNPYQTKKQRREAEVKQLLEKINHELISLDNNLLGEVNTQVLESELEAKPQYIKKSDIDLSHRRRRKSAKIPVAKQKIQSELKLRAIREKEQNAKKVKKIKSNKESELDSEGDSVPKNLEPLDRFVKKKK